jgi:replicative DNA helicase
LAENPKYEGKKFYLFSYEESSQKVTLKVLNILSGKLFNVNHNLDLLEDYIRNEESDIAEVENGKSKLKSLLDAGRINIIDKTFDSDELNSIIKELCNQNDVGAVFIDYIQKIRSKNGAPTRQMELQRISGDLLDTAKSCKIPVVLAAQLNRQTSSGHMSMDNLRECGDLEQDAALILGVYNPSFDNGPKKSKEESLFEDSQKHIQVHILKNRFGEVGGKVNLKFNAPLSKIESR